ATFHLKVILPQFDPRLKIYNDSRSVDLTNAGIEMNLGHLVLDLLGADTSTLPIDTLNLSLIAATGDVAPSGYTFAPATGLHTVNSKFMWDPDCSIFKPGSYDNHYRFQFLVANYHCKTPSTDTAYVNVRIKDIESDDSHFLPANVITTFPDHCNDFFAIEGFESEPNCDGQIRPRQSVPVENCANQFERVRIYDRWGKLVFESDDRKFRWYARSESAGVYYYSIKYTRKEYKSTLTVIH
ncbi:MAG TPA: gliding motility-associated C-terminal domain-containing protein, partial [Cyclobacteriaceae bacterium]|nr:gliding motility-associated C-terminal domain-containing protein [Cyclobacteriaceae bacterium]